MKQRFELLKSLQITTEIAFCLTNKNEDLTYSIPEYHMPNLIDFAIHKFNDENGDMEQPLIFSFHPNILVGITQLSEHSYLILGPCMPQHHSSEYLSHFLFEASFRKDKRELLRCLENSKQMSLEGLKQALCLAHYINTGKQISSSNILTKLYLNTNSLDDGELIAILEQQSNINIENSEVPGELYAKLVLLDNLPSLASLMEMFTTPTEQNFIPMSQNHDRQTKYIFMLAANTFCKEAIERGVSVHLAHSICAHFCQKVDTAPAYFDVQPIYIELLQSFTTAIEQSESHVHHYTTPITKCINYINSHISERITLEVLSEICKVSPRWLSKCFRNEVGISIPDYINEKKLERSIQLLRYTNRSIEEISSYLHISNSSYFCKLFRQKYGYSPMEYRKKVLS